MSTQVTLLRDRRTKPRDFRGLLRELSSYVGYEATRSLSTVPRHDCVTPRGVHVPADGRATRLAARCALVPIMRAGLGMVESMQALLPNAAVHQIGMFKRSGSDRPVEYYSRLPKHGGDSCDIAFILDPVVATAKTMTPVIAKLKAWGAHRIVACTVLASAAVWKSTSALGAPDNSSLWPCWLRRAVGNRHRHAIEQASRRWRGGRTTRRFRTRRKF